MIKGTLTPAAANRIGRPDLANKPVLIQPRPNDKNMAQTVHYRGKCIATHVEISKNGVVKQ